MCESFATPWTVAHLVPLPMGFPRQEHWSGLLFSSPEDLPDPVIEPMPPLSRKILYCLATREAQWPYRNWKMLILSSFFPLLISLLYFVYFYFLHSIYHLLSYYIIFFTMCIYSCCIHKDVNLGALIIFHRIRTIADTYFTLNEDLLKINTFMNKRMNEKQLLPSIYYMPGLCYVFCMYYLIFSHKTLGARYYSKCRSWHLEKCVTCPRLHSR